jgi:hypothetical protein
MYVCVYSRISIRERLKNKLLIRLAGSILLMWRGGLRRSFVGVFDPRAVYNVDTPMAAKETPHQTRSAFISHQLGWLLTCITGLCLDDGKREREEEEQGLSFFCFSAVLMRGASSFNTCRARVAGFFELLYICICLCFMCNYSALSGELSAPTPPLQNRYRATSGVTFGTFCLLHREHFCAWCVRAVLILFMQLFTFFNFLLRETLYFITFFGPSFVLFWISLDDVGYGWKFM